MVTAGLSFPSAAPSDATHWPFSCTARASQAKRPSELTPCIQPQTRERVSTDCDPQRRFHYLFSAFSLAYHENSRQNYCKLICRGLMVRANRLLICANKHAIRLVSP